MWRRESVEGVAVVKKAEAATVLCLRYIQDQSCHPTKLLSTNMSNEIEQLRSLVESLQKQVTRLSGTRIAIG